MTPLAMTLAALGLAGSAVTPTLANETEKMTIQVQYDDLDLATPEGQQRLDQRLEKAVRTVCRTKSHTGGSRILSLDAKACLAKARTDARQQVAALTKGKQRGV
ncbi:MAG TPA: UrcA family protein [Erythrobacter sp.]|nr:UrcA family protein [Erythrobacter sp.]